MKKVFLLGTILLATMSSLWGAMQPRILSAEKDAIKILRIINRTGHSLRISPDAIEGIKTLLKGLATQIVSLKRGPNYYMFNLTLEDKAAHLRREFIFKLSYDDLFVKNPFDGVELSLNIFEHMEKCEKNYDKDLWRLTFSTHQAHSKRSYK